MSDTPGPGRPGGDDTVKLDRSVVLREPSFPEAFGRYQVRARIGLGGFATVYAGVDPTLDAPVAIKVLAENHAANPEVRRRFVSEARVARRLGHDRLIGVYDLGETPDGRPYVVMELADRGTLRQRMTGLGTRPGPADLGRLVGELGACLAAIHAHGVVHRDIKPTNLLLRSVASPNPAGPATAGSTAAAGGSAATAGDGALVGRDERLVLADFGLARDISGGASEATVGGGTAGYMAPEQADPFGQADIRADLYAATVVVAELATGLPPDRLDLARAPIPEPLRRALARGMAPARSDRPASATAWRDELLAALATATTTGPEAGPSTDQPGDTTRRLDLTTTDQPGDTTRRLDLTTTDPPGDATRRLSPDPVDIEAPPDGPPDATRLLEPTRVQARPVWEVTRVREARPEVPYPYSQEAYSDLGVTPVEPAPGHEPPLLTTATAARLAAEAAVGSPSVQPPPPPPSLPQAHPEPPPALLQPPAQAPAPPAPVPLRTHAAQAPAPAAPVPLRTHAAQTPGPAAPVPVPTHAAQTPGPTWPAPGVPVGQPLSPLPVGHAGAGPTSSPPPPSSAVRVLTAPPPPPAAPAPWRPPPGHDRPLPLGAPVPGTGPTGPPVPGYGARPHPGGAGAGPLPGPMPPPSGRPVLIGPTGGPTAEARSRQHLKTAARLARLEQREQARQRRRARRRRRRIRLLNLVLGLVRGSLAAVLAYGASLVLLANRAGVPVEALGPRAHSLASGFALSAFLLGLAWFPWPRPRPY